MLLNQALRRGRAWDRARRGGCGRLLRPRLRRQQQQQQQQQQQGLASGSSKAPPPPSSSEVDAEERAAWRRQFKRPHHHHEQHKKPPAVLARLDPAGIVLDEAGRTAFEGDSFELCFGDHVLVLGDNGAGKQLFWQALSGRRSLLQQEGGAKGKAGTDVGGSKAFMFMSFSMHEGFLAKNAQRIVADVLGGASDPLARRLIVTLGLYPLWYKKVSWLSTGEIRRVLLASVLSRAPRVLVLDKPFDGLDGPSRKNLLIILSQMCQGFPRLLVDLGLARKSIDRTSMVLITHRHEEVPEEVTRVVAVEGLRAAELEGPMQEHKAGVRRRLTHVFPSPEPLVHKLPRSFRPQVPRAETLSDARPRDKENLSSVLEFRGVRLQKGEYVILDGVDWRVKQGQIWAVKGHNGSGKSTTTRLLMEAFEARQLEDEAKLHSKHHNDRHHKHAKPSYEGRVAVGVPHVGWVSTEVHLALAQRCAGWSTAQVILSGLYRYEQEHGRRHQEGLVDVHPARGYHPPRPPADAVPPKLAPLLGEWAALLELSEDDMAKPFCRLSQGQQKLALVARALIGAPQLLIVDEVCQGLDSRHRALVLSLLDTIGRTAGGWLAMLYITHHQDEALPAVSHVLELEKGRVAFQGTAAEYAAAEQARRAQERAAGVGAESKQGNGVGLVQG